VSARRTVYTAHPVDTSIRLVQFRRSETDPTVEAEITLPTGRKIVSTGKQDVLAAAFEAVAIKAKLLGLIEATGTAKLRKRPEAAKPTGPTFGEAAQEVLAEQEEQWRVEKRRLAGQPRRVIFQKESKFEAHRLIIKNHLSCLSDKRFEEITAEVVDKMLSNCRIVEGVDPDTKEFLTRPPSQSTIGNIAHTYKIVMTKLASKSNATTPFPRLSRRNFKQAEPRAAFDRAEVEQIIAAMSDDWIDDTRRAQTRETRRLLRAYVHLAASTGIRAGLEIERLTFGQIKTAIDRKTRRSFRRIAIYRDQGKYVTDREAVENIRDQTVGLDAALADIRFIHGQNPAPNQLLFTRSDGQIPVFTTHFKNLLIEHGLYLEPGTGDERALYSLRHYFANSMIEEGIDTYRLAQVMGTSSAMIEKFYGKALSRRTQAEVSGVRDDIARLRGALGRQRAAEANEPDVNDPLEEHDQDAE
jgi:site-specific recombinase XerD